MNKFCTLMLSFAVVVLGTANANDAKVINQEIVDIVKFDVGALNETTLRFDDQLKKWVLDLAGTIDSFGYFAGFLAKSPEKVVLTLTGRMASGILPSYELEMNILAVSDDAKTVTNFPKQPKAILTDGSTTAFRTTIVLPTQPFAKATQPVKVILGFPKGFDAHPPRVDLVYDPATKKYELHSGVLKPKPFDGWWKDHVFVFKKVAIEPNLIEIVDKKVDVPSHPFTLKDFGGKETTKELPYFSFNVNLNLKACALSKESAPGELRVFARFERSNRLTLASVQETLSTDAVPVLDPTGELCENGKDVSTYSVNDGAGFAYAYGPFLEGKEASIRQGSLSVGGKSVTAYFVEKDKAWKVTLW